jgi:GMP synthase (glutamine-hydrolysing)
MTVWMSHGDKLSKLPEGFHVIATTNNSPYAGIAHKTKPVYGIQFHPEVSHTPRGIKLLDNFAAICDVRRNWTMSNFVEQEIARIRALVGPKAQVIGAVSGGVDSTVAARLMKEAIGDRFHAVLVDNGVMRLNECEQVKQTLAEHLGINLTVVDASEKFLSVLKGVEDPEVKRKRIGHTFVSTPLGPTPFSHPGGEAFSNGPYANSRLDRGFRGGGPPHREGGRELALRWQG